MTQEIALDVAQRLLLEKRRQLGLNRDGTPAQTTRLGDALGSPDSSVQERIRAIVARVPDLPHDDFLPRASGAAICPDCQDRGQILTPTGVNEVRVEDCHCEVQRKLDRAAHLAGLPRDAADWSLDTLQVDDGNSGTVELMRQWLADVDGSLTAGTGFYLYGAYGVGKTYIAGAFANACLARRISICWLSAAKIGPLFFESWNQGEGAEMRLTQQLEHCDVLFLDDIDKVQKTPAVVAKLWALVDARYHDRKPMVVTANKPLVDLSEVFGPEVGGSMASRLAGRCYYRQLKGPDRRAAQNPGVQP